MPRLCPKPTRACTQRRFAARPLDGAKGTDSAGRLRWSTLRSCILRTQSRPVGHPWPTSCAVSPPVTAKRPSDTIDCSRMGRAESRNAKSVECAPDAMTALPTSRRVCLIHFDPDCNAAALHRTTYVAGVAVDVLQRSSVSDERLAVTGGGFAQEAGQGWPAGRP